MTNGEIALQQIWPTATQGQVEGERERERERGGEYSNCNVIQVYSYCVHQLSLNKIYKEVQTLR
jgi:tryptophanyl-tRNA synthetase